MYIKKNSLAYHACLVIVNIVYCSMSLTHSEKQQPVAHFRFLHFLLFFCQRAAKKKKKLID